MNNPNISPTPYKGLMPYSEADAILFFGRETFQDLVINYLQAERLTLLYGASGVGKSSLLRAGVVHRLRRLAEQNVRQRESAEFCVVIFNEWRDDPVVGLLRQVRETIERYNPQPVELAADTDSLAGTLDQWAEQIDCDLLIILDQFEEYFMYHSQVADDKFGIEFERAVNNRNLRANFLVAVREDTLAKLDRYKASIPSLFQNTLRVKHLDHNAARDAIIKPIEQYNSQRAAGEQIKIEAGLVEDVLAQVAIGATAINSHIFSQRGTEQQQNMQIEAPYLQLVMTRLWELDRRSHVLKQSTFKDLGGSMHIVDNHLSLTVTTLSPSEQKIAARIFRYLVTPSGTKITQSATDIASYSMIPEGDVINVLDKLSGMRILRAIAPSQNQPDSPRYEIFHDVLAAPINAWWEQYEEDERLKKVQEEAAQQKELYRARFLSRGVVVLGTLLLILIGLTLYAFKLKAEAITAKLTADQQRTEAIDARQATELAKEEVERISNEREKNRIDAISQKERADEQAIKAKNAAKDALAAQAEAEKQKGISDKRARDLEIALADVRRANEKDTLNRDALIAFERGDTNVAEEKFIELRDHNQRDPNIVAWASYNLGAIYRKEGRYDQAVNSYQEAQAKQRMAHSEGGRDVAAILNKLGQTYREQGNFPDAEKSYIEARNILKCDQDANNAFCINLTSDQADLLVDYAKDASVSAEAKDEAADEIGYRVDELESRESDPKIDAIIKQSNDEVEKLRADVSNLEKLSKQKYADAEALYTKVIMLREKKLSPNHPDLAVTYNSMSSLYENKDYPDKDKKVEEAKALRELASAIREYRPIPDRHDKLEAEKLIKLAAVYISHDKSELADKLYEMFETAVRSLSELDDTYFASKLIGAGELYSQQENYAKARQYFLKALPIYERMPTKGEENPFLGLLESIGHTYYLQKDYSAAEPYMRRVLSIRQQALQTGGDIKVKAYEYIDSLLNMAFIFEKETRLSDAETHYHLAVETAKQQFSKESGMADWTAISLAKFYFEQKRYDEAETEYKRLIVTLTQKINDVKLGGIPADSHGYIIRFKVRNGFTISIPASEYVDALSDLAFIQRNHRRNYAEAESHYKEMVVTLEWLRKYLPGSSNIRTRYGSEEARKKEIDKYEVLYAEALESYASLLSEMPNRTTEAAQMKERAAAVRRSLGPIKEEEGDDELP